MTKKDNDLNDLVSMAESVSEKVQSLEKKIIFVKNKFYFSFLGIFFGFTVVFFLIDNKYMITEGFIEYFYLILFIFIVLSFIFFMNIFINFNRIKSFLWEVRSEKSILKELLDLVFEYKAHLSKNDISPVENALIEIRLKRIKFSTKW